MDGFEKEVCKRLPLAEAVLRLFRFTCDPEFLEDVFERHRGRSYTRELTFPTMVHLISDALMEHEGSGHKSFQRAEQAGQLDASIRAAYGKLARLPLPLSTALLCEASGRLRKLFPEAVEGWQVPESLAELEVVFHDGKKIKHVAKRLAALRTVRGQVMGGKLVVSQSLNTGLALVMAASEDGEAADQPLVPSALQQLRQAVDGVRLHVGDRMFCDLKQAEMYRADGDHFLLRWNKKVRFHRDDQWETLVSTDRYGRTVREDWGWIGGESDSRRCYVRRIHLEREDGEDVILLTDLTESETHPADDLLEVYLFRWGIESMFQKVTQVFHLQDLIGSTPQATVFQASFCFLLYNMIQVMRGWIATGQEMEPTEISSETLFYDVHAELVSWNRVLAPTDTIDLLSTTWTAPQVKRRLEQLLCGHWSECWLKAPSNTHVNPPPERIYLEGGHASVFRLLQNNPN